MWIVLLTLLVPLVAVALLVTDAWRQSALPFPTRSQWSLAVRGLSGLCFLIAAGLLAAGISTAIQEPRTLLLVLPLLVALSTVVIYTGFQGMKVPRSWPRDDEDWDDPAVVERCTPHSLLCEPVAARLRSGAWCMLLYPLLFVLPILGFFGMALFFIAIVTVTAVVHSRRGFQSQLLWLLAIAVRNQLPLADELRDLGLRRGVSLRIRLAEAANHLESGDPLWLVLERARLAPPAAVSAIRMAEGGGRLEETLRQLAVNSTSRLRVFSISGLSDVLTQFLVTMTVALTIVSFLMYYIVPKFKFIFDGFDIALPRSTRALIDGSDYAMNKNFSPLLFWSGLGISAIAWQMLRHVIGWSSLPMPILMHFHPRRDAPEVLRVIGGLIREQASLPEKLRELVTRRGRPDLGARYQRIANRIDSGELLSVALLQEGILSRAQADAIAAAERGGHLEFVFFALADAAEQREFRQSATWAELVKPLSVLACGALVAFIVLAFFLPLVKILKEYH